MTNPFCKGNTRNSGFSTSSMEVSLEPRYPTSVLALKVLGVGPLVTPWMGTLWCRRGCSEAGEEHNEQLPGGAEAWLRTLPSLPFPASATWPTGPVAAAQLPLGGAKQRMEGSSLGLERWDSRGMSRSLSTCWSSRSPLPLSLPSSQADNTVPDSHSFCRQEGAQSVSAQLSVFSHTKRCARR